MKWFHVFKTVCRDGGERIVVGAVSAATKLEAEAKSRRVAAEIVPGEPVSLVMVLPETFPAREPKDSQLDPYE